MKLIGTFFCYLIITFCSLEGANGIRLYISPDGCDSGPGTIEEPFATLQRARDAIRVMKVRDSGEQSYEVILREGTYYLNEPLVLEPRDSGKSEAPVVWRSAEGEAAVISGGTPIAADWKTDDGRIWSTTIPGIEEGDWYFRQLFVDGQRATRARYPNVSESNPFLYATEGSMDSVRINKRLIKESWGAEPDAQINIVVDWRFFNQWNTVKSVDLETGTLFLEDSELQDDIIKGNWFWIEGVREELDEPGEWYLDTAQARLFYMPEAGINPNSLTFIAPRIDRIIYAKGDVEKGTHVEHVSFKGLEFRHTRFTLGQIEMRVHTDAAILLENACHVAIEGCRFENIGGYALWLHLDSKRNTFHRNEVYHSGGGGVLATGARFAYMDESKIYTPGKEAAKVFPILNRITHNVVKHCGKIRYYGGGVHLDSRPYSMSMDPGNYIAHNHFEDLSRNGIFAFRNQGGNIIEYNHIHDAMQTTIDGACIHVATMNRLTAPNYILNNYLYDIWGFEQMPDGKPHRVLANGIFLDWATSNTAVKNNYIYNSGERAIKPIMGNWNLDISNNVTSDTRIVPPFVDEVGPQGTATHGIDLESNRLVGGVIHYSEEKLVEKTGEWEAREIEGFRNLFSFKMLELDKSSTGGITYTLPVTEAGLYKICLIYMPASQYATDAKLTIEHAAGVDVKMWNFSEGHKFGFAVEVGQYPMEPGKPAQVTISRGESSGSVVADSVGFVKVE